MVDHVSPKNSAHEILAEFKDGVVIVPSAVVAEWNGMSVRHVRVSVDVSDEANDESIDAIVRVQKIERAIAGEALAAAGSLARGSFGDRAARLW